MSKRLEVIVEITKTQNDINAYLKFTSVPLECYMDDIDFKLNEMKEKIAEILDKPE